MTSRKLGAWAWQLATVTGSGLAVAGAVHSVWNLKQLRVLPRPRSSTLRVSVLIPARDEANNIGHCLNAVRNQKDVAELEIIVYDDHSSDGTSDVVAHHLADKRVRLITSSSEPPSGWLGKPWACHQLAEAATGQLLVFLDADVTLEPNAIARLTAAFSSDDIAAVSPYPRQIATSYAERIVQPLLQWSWATLLPLALAESSARPSLVAANGQLLAVTRDAYDDMGGHAAVPNQVLDDIGLFRSLKTTGHRVSLADGTDVASCHMYGGWAEVRDGYSKSLAAAVPGTGGAAAVAGTFALAYLIPPLAALGGSWVGAVGYASASAGRAVVAARVGGRVWPDSLFHPASVACAVYLLARSHWGRRKGTLIWKGRPVA